VAQTSEWAQQEVAEEVKDEGLDSEVALEASVASEEEEEEEEEEESSGDGDVVGGEEELYPEPPEEAKLYVGNLPYDVDSEKLANIFNEAGVVEIAEVNFGSFFLHS
jgi:nucleolin